jgi:hypothetical protein
MTPPIPDFDFFARYILAGFIIFTVRGAFIVEERPKLAEITLDVLFLGLVNQMVWQLLTFLTDAGTALSSDPARLARIADSQFPFFLEVLALPLALGLLLGRAARSGVQAGIARSFSLPVVGPIKRAYDAVFLELSQSRPCFVIVTLEDGTRIFGLFGSHSHAGRDPERSELLLERVYELDDAENWVEADPPRSVLIRLAKLKTIEFFKSPGS